MYIHKLFSIQILFFINYFLPFTYIFFAPISLSQKKSLTDLNIEEDEISHNENAPITRSISAALAQNHADKDSEESE